MAFTENGHGILLEYKLRFRRFKGDVRLQADQETARIRGVDLLYRFEEILLRGDFKGFVRFCQRGNGEQRCCHDDGQQTTKESVLH